MEWELENRANPSPVIFHSKTKMVWFGIKRINIFREYINELRTNI